MKDELVSRGVQLSSLGDDAPRGLMVSVGLDFGAQMSTDGKLSVGGFEMQKSTSCDREVRGWECRHVAASNCKL